MLQLSNCCLEDLKTWSNIGGGGGGGGIPLDNGQWKEGAFIIVFASMNLTECHRMALPGDPMCGLHEVRKGHDHKSIYNIIEEAQTGHRSSIFKGLPVQLKLQ